MSKIDLKQVRKILERTRPGIRIEPEIFDTAVLLYCSAFTGPNIQKLVKATKLSKLFIVMQAKSFMELGIWTSKKVIADWTDPVSGNAMFWTDVLAACKKLPRLPEEILAQEI